MNFSYRSWYSVLMITLMLLAGVMAPLNAGAVRTFDNGAGTGLASTPANWSDDTRPTSADTAFCDGTSDSNITFDSSFNYSCLKFGAGYDGKKYFGATIDTTGCYIDSTNDSTFWQTANIYWSGNLRFTGTGVLTPGTSGLWAIGTGIQFIKMATPASQQIYDETALNNTGKVVDSTLTGLDVLGDADFNKSANLVYGMDCAGDLSFDTAGVTPDTLTVGTDTLQMNGPASNLHIGIGSVVSAANATVYMATSTAGVTDIDKIVNMKSLYINGVVVNSGAATNTYSSATTPLIITNNSSFTSTVSLLQFQLTGTGQNFHSIGTGVTLVGSDYSWNVAANSIVANFPAWTSTGTGTFSFQDAGNKSYTFNVTGNLSIGAGALRMRQSAFGGAKTQFNITASSVQAASISTGTGNATDTVVSNYGSATYDVRSITGATFNTGVPIDSFKTSVWTVSGNVTMGTNHTVDPGTSAWTIDSTSTVTSAGKTWAKDITFSPGTGKSDSLADNLTVTGDIRHTNGKLKMGGRNVSCQKFISTGDSLFARMALDTLTATDSVVMTGVNVVDSLCVKISGSQFFKQGTLTLKRLLHSAAAAYTKFCGTGTINISNSPTQGSVQSIAAGTINFLSKFKLDSLILNPGTATLAGAGDDTAGSIIVTGGDLNITGDSIVITGNLTGSTAGGITGDSLSVIKMTGSGKRLALFPGDSIPGKIRISGTPIYIDSGGTAAGLWFDVDGINCKFQPNKRYTFTDTLACGGLNASTRDSISSQTATQRDTIDLPSKFTFKNMWIRDNVFIDTVTCNRSDSCLSSGGNY